MCSIVKSLCISTWRSPKIPTLNLIRIQKLKIRTRKNSNLLCQSQRPITQKFYFEIFKSYRNSRIYLFRAQLRLPSETFANRWVAVRVILISYVNFFFYCENMNRAWFHGFRQVTTARSIIKHYRLLMRDLFSLNIYVTWTLCSWTSL